MEQRSPITPEQIARSLSNCLQQYADVTEKITELMIEHKVDPISGDVILAWLLGASMGMRDQPLHGTVTAAIIDAARQLGWAQAVQHGDHS